MIGSNTNTLRGVWGRANPKVLTSRTRVSAKRELGKGIKVNDKRCLWKTTKQMCKCEHSLTLYAFIHKELPFVGKFVKLLTSKIDAFTDSEWLLTCKGNKHGTT